LIRWRRFEIIKQNINENITQKAQSFIAVGLLCLETAIALLNVYFAFSSL